MHKFIHQSANGVLHQRNYNTLVGPAVAVAMAADDDVFDAFRDIHVLHLGGNLVGSNTWLRDVCGRELNLVRGKYRDVVHHVFAAVIGMVNGNIEIPQAIGLGGFDHQHVDLVRESGEGDG